MGADRVAACSARPQSETGGHSTGRSRDARCHARSGACGLERGLPVVNRGTQTDWPIGVRRVAAALSGPLHRRPDSHTAAPHPGLARSRSCEFARCWPLSMMAGSMDSRDSIQLAAAAAGQRRVCRRWGSSRRDQPESSKPDVTVSGTPRRALQWSREPARYPVTRHRAVSRFYCTPACKQLASRLRHQRLLPTGNIAIIHKRLQSSDCLWRTRVRVSPVPRAIPQRAALLRMPDIRPLGGRRRHVSGLRHCDLAGRSGRPGLAARS
jgi:hypothetical protein